MKLATWNVNSLKVRLPHVLDWLAKERPDVLGIQETKMEDKAFPYAELQAAGYAAIHNGQKTYNGVALLGKSAALDEHRDIPAFDDAQKRIVAANYDGIRVICAYFPNGQAVGSEKYEYKLRWLKALRDWLGEELKRYPRLALLGDYNVAPEDRDVHDPVAWKDQVLCSEPERQALRDIAALGLVDAFRLFEQPEKSYSWWDYRMMGFRRNHGLRIDHILLSKPLAEKCTACRIDREPRKLERPSDHAPVMAEINI